VTSSLDLLAAVVRGQPPAADAFARLDPQAFLRLAAVQGVLPLIADRLGACEDVPESLRRRLRTEASREAAVALLRDVELRAALAALDADGIAVLLLKGAQLAHTHYERPDLRPRLDSDVLVPEVHRGDVHRVVMELGYEPVRQFTGDLVTYQVPYVKRRDGAVVHVLDVHWRVANPQRFGAMLAQADAAAASVSVPGLGAVARGLGGPHALLVACVHPVAHHADSQRLIWKHDIHLLASRFDGPAWTQFVDLVRARGMASICQRSLGAAAVAFGTSVPEMVFTRLSEPSVADAETAVYLAPRRRHIQAVFWDVRSMPTWGDRLRLMGQHLFPPAPYMREVYAPASRVPLPILYAQRAFRGARRWLARS
jgi:hypothetical protein